ncbi:SDR family oxidoreductase [Eubacterium barkeri]|uniref:NADP-dependent 3-hydroxy acid dehydrogenase YdfG n=1 Tax=Eubacterium barkeri TaxID=1528 RepID=A0A1H3JJT6_EUBBA|nr:SDR family oxidoreductase [Eubacterium barkeri]SDY40223.1 NADP-dependent 3-hydroxy acid dehydrogenase YdfG [Eubacterium barkeri]
MRTNKKLENKIALITGGASGIGEAIAKIYASEGCNMLLIDVNGERLTTVVDEIKAMGVECEGITADVSDEQSVIAFFKTAMDKWGRIDLVVNSAGRDSLAPPISQVTMEEWNKTIGPNLTGVFLCCREAFRVMEKQETGGRIMNIGSSSTKVASCPGHSPYRASKHGMLGLSKNILLEGMNKNIGVTVINPSHVKTPMTEVIDSGEYDGGLTAYVEGWLDEKELKEGIHASCIDVSNVAEIALFVATRTPDVTIPTISFYPTHKIPRYGMEV